jgi:Domain of unknown function (4846)
MRPTPLILFLVIAGCTEPVKHTPAADEPAIKTPTHYTRIEEIALPAGFERIEAIPHSFEEWLRRLPLKKDKTVYLYNGQIKPNQSAQFAVVDISGSKTDLQQCADVVMRLRAEYLFTERKFDSIRFMDYNKKWYNWTGKDNRQLFDSYMQQVFGWCGSASLEKQMQPVRDFAAIKAGDVLIRGGFPGHAMIVADLAINNKGEKIFLLVQGYQPAQDVHVVVNPSDKALSPWYNITEMNEIITPEWKFYKTQLYSW